MKGQTRKIKNLLIKLEKCNWDGLWLFCSGDSLNLMRADKDGNRIYNDSGSVSQKSIIDEYFIPSDGGDW